MAQVITLHSPASVGMLTLIEDQPGITTGELATQGGWSVFHVRNVLRFLRAHGKVKSERPVSNGECQWWIGQHQGKLRTTKQKPRPVTYAVSSVFAFGSI